MTQFVGLCLAFMDKKASPTRAQKTSRHLRVTSFQSKGAKKSVNEHAVVRKLKLLFILAA